MIRRKADPITTSRSRSTSPTTLSARPGSTTVSLGKAAPRAGGLFRSGKRGSGSSEDVGATRRFRIGLLLVAKAAVAVVILAYRSFSSTSSRDPALRSSAASNPQSSLASQPLIVDGIPVNEATRRMYAQDSRWVDGEKALKRQLQKLAQLQAAGKELGVPALTRYLGEDFPAWAGTGINRAEWEAKRDEKYAEMRKAETEWNKKITQLIDQDKQRG